MYFWVLKILLVSLDNKMGKGWNVRQFLKAVLKYAVLVYFIFLNFQNWRPFFWKAETQQASNWRTMASNPSQFETVQLCYESSNRSCIKSPYLPASWVILYTGFSFGSLLAIFGNFLVMTSAFSSSLQAAAFASQFLDRLSGLRGLSGGSDPDALQHGQVRGELLVLWSPICALHSSCDVAFCYSSLFHLCFISIDRYVVVTDPLVYPTKFTGSVSGECVSISWILPLVYSGAVFFTGVHENRIKELVSALICTGSCQLVINQFWILITFLLFFVPTFIMIILCSNIFLVARQQAIKIEHISSKVEGLSGIYKTRVTKREESS